MTPEVRLIYAKHRQQEPIASTKLQTNTISTAKSRPYDAGCSLLRLDQRFPSPTERQYCGQLGKTANCQVAVSLSVASDTASLPIAYRLFLPQDWADDDERRAKTGVPDDITFQTKGEIALEQIKVALAAGITPGVILGDAGYGPSTPFRTAITELGLTYSVGVLPNISIWPPGTAPLPPTGKGRRANIRLRRDKHHQPVSAKELAQSLSKDQWQGNRLSCDFN